MPATMLESEQFSSAFPAAAEAAQSDAVFISNHGDPVLVILNIERYREMLATKALSLEQPTPTAKPSRSLYDLFNVPGLSDEEADFEFTRVDNPSDSHRDIDFS